MFKKNILFFIPLIFFQTICFPQKEQSNKARPDMYFCMAADKAFFSQLLTLIGSIHKNNFCQVKEIAVFDLGFTKKQREFLNIIEKLSIHSVEMTHPKLLTPFKTRKNGKFIKGWYAWKPVIIKQALEMFPYVLYIDAGCRVLKPLDDIFFYIKHNKYLLMQNNVKFTILPHCTKHIIELFRLTIPERSWILNKLPISAGLQGLSKELYDSYVRPIYELTKDLKNFEDDGSSPLGFGWARHDQTLFSIYAHLLGLTMVPANQLYKITIDDNPLEFCIGNKSWVKGMHIVYHPRTKSDAYKYIQFKKTSIKNNYKELRKFLSGE